jgi:hypothetical protein
MESWLPLLRAAFEANVVVNAAVIVLLVIGLAIAIAQVVALRPVRHWVDQASRGFAVDEPPALIAALARALSGKEREGVVLSLAAMGSLLATVRRRMDESRHAATLVLAALVFLTLIGAFWSAAHFGVVATLILGLAVLAVRRAQNSTLEYVEDFLARRAALPSSLLGGESSLPAYLEALLKQTAENLTEIQRMMVRTEEERHATHAALGSLTETLSGVSDQLKAQQKVILTLSKNHYDLQPAIADLATQVAGALAGSDEMRNHLRSVDLAVARLVDEVSAARTQTPAAMRQEIKVLAQTLARSAGNSDRPHF